MNVVRGIFSWLCLYLVGTAFFITASLFALLAVLNPATIKDTLREKNVYSSVVPSVLSSANYQQQSVGQLPLQDPGVRSAVEKAFPASDLEQKTNTVIDSTFVWLEGKTEKPDFKLDFTQNKQQLATELGNYTEDRVESLPRCTLANLPETYDPLTIKCLPPGVSASGLSEVVRQQVSNDQNFLKETVITSDTLTLDPANTTGATNPLDGLDSTRTLYQNKTLLMWLLPILTILLAAAGLLLAQDRAKGLRRLATSFLFSAIGLFLLALALGFGLQQLIGAVASDPISRDVLGPAITGLVQHTQTTYYIFVGVALAISIAMFIGSRSAVKKSI